MFEHVITLLQSYCFSEVASLHLYSFIRASLLVSYSLDQMFGQNEPIY